MEITFDKAKRDDTLANRGLDFADAAIVFEGAVFTRDDARRDYGEARFVSYGDLRGTIVAIVWTVRDGTRRVISMRNAKEGERDEYRSRMG